MRKGMLSRAQRALACYSVLHAPGHQTSSAAAWDAGCFDEFTLVLCWSSINVFMDFVSILMDFFLRFDKFWLAC